MPRLSLLILLLVGCAHAVDADVVPLEPLYSYHVIGHETGARDHGSGVALNLPKYGHCLVTALHVVKDSQTISALQGKQEHEAHVLLIIKSLDIAILSTHELPLYAEPDSRDMDEGDRIETVSHPSGQAEQLIGHGVIETQNRATSPGFYHGSSGCPVFYQGRVVGIAVAGFAGPDHKMVPGELQYVPIREIIHYLKR